MINKVFRFIKQVLCVAVDVCCYIVKLIISGVKRFFGLIGSVLK